MSPDDCTRQLTVIGGSYKSGTSLLCALVEAMGYANPALLTNPGELGHGLAVDLYETRECSVARCINRTLITASDVEAKRIEWGIAGYLEDMFQCAGPRLVIKDPYMKLLAANWIRAAKRVGVESARLFVTQRDPRSIHASIHNSRFLRCMQIKKAKVFDRLINPLDRPSVTCLESLGATVQRVPYELIADTNPNTRAQVVT